jgi:hypothetical protein
MHESSVQVPDIAHERERLRAGKRQRCSVPKRATRRPALRVAKVDVLMLDTPGTGCCWTRKKVYPIVGSGEPTKDRALGEKRAVGSGRATANQYFDPGPLSHAIELK